MNRNVETHFAKQPNINIGRSRFDRSSSHKTSFNVGDVIPFYIDEVLPGDTFDVKTSKVIRMQSLMDPIMDNIYLDTYYFFVPMRLLWNHTKEFFGENTTAPWIPTTSYQIPQLTAPSGGWNVGTLADYFGIPTGVSGLSVNALPFRAYALCMNEWLRDENLTTPCNITLGDTTNSGSNGNNYVTDTQLGGAPYKAAKYHDYFTSCTPGPQKHADITVPLGNSAPVYTGSVNPTPKTKNPLMFNRVDGSSYPSTGYNYSIFGYSDTSDKTLLSVSQGSGIDPTGSKFVYPTNLYTDLSLATSASINQLREAFQIQKFYERAASSGSRYREVIKGHFGVNSPDARMQIPEYLGGNRIGININQVVQTSATVSGQTPQGNTTAYSQTNDKHSDFIKSFTEHGYVLGVMVARYDHTYQQGLEKLWSRKDMFDFYWPEFANLGNQAVKLGEIYAQGTSADTTVFGYQEAWAEYRYKPNRVSGEMRSSYATSLDSWHLGDDYASAPSLSDSWIREDKSNVDRVLAVQSSTSNQLFGDIYIKNICTRPMPVYSIPGLMDHH